MCFIIFKIIVFVCVWARTSVCVKDMTEREREREREDFMSIIWQQSEIKREDFSSFVYRCIRSVFLKVNY